MKFRFFLTSWVSYLCQYNIFVVIKGSHIFIYDPCLSFLHWTSMILSWFWIPWTPFGDFEGIADHTSPQALRKMRASTLIQRDIAVGGNTKMNSFKFKHVNAGKNGVLSFWWPVESKVRTLPWGGSCTKLCFPFATESRNIVIYENYINIFTVCRYRNTM